MKLDGDIELPPHYLRELMERFDADPQLGLAGGVLDEPAADGGMRRIRIARNHVHGALKCYSRACFEAIGGVQERLGWDTIDETYARMRGFGTAQLHRPRVDPSPADRQRRRHGARPRAPRRVRLHRALTATWVALRSVKIATAALGLSGLAFFYGYVRAAARRVERVPDPEYRRFTQRELRRRMLGAVVPRHGGSAMSIGIVGLGYVGLPARDGVRRRRGWTSSASTSTRRRSPDLRAGRSPHRGRRRRAALRGARALPLHHPLRRPARGRGDPHLRPDAADRQPRAGARPAAERPRARSAAVIRAGQVVVLESTTFPGTTREYLVPLLEESGPARRRGLRAGVLARARRPGPRRLHDPHDAEDRRRADAGAARSAPSRSTAASATASCRSAQPEARSWPSCSRTSSARSTSRSSTRWRCSPTAWGSTSGRSIDAASTKPFGFMRFEPGPGMGGHCLPVDPFYLTWRAREFDVATEFIELAGKVNQQMPYFCWRRSSRRSTTPASRSTARDPHPRRLVQAGRRRHPRVARAEDHRAAPAPRRRRRLPRPVRAGAERVRAAPRRARRALDRADLAVIVTAHPGVDHEAVVGGCRRGGLPRRHPPRRGSHARTLSGARPRS